MFEYCSTMNVLIIYTELVVLFCTSTDLNSDFLTLSWEGGPYHTESSPSICTANQWAGFYMIGTSAMKKLTTNIKYFNNCKRV